MCCPKCKKEKYIINTTACNSSTYTWTPENFTGANCASVFNWTIKDMTGTNSNAILIQETCECDKK